MARTTSAAVQAILLQDYDSVDAPSLKGFIDTAAALVGRVVECAARKGVTYSPLELELLERWVAAHLYGMSDQPYSARSTLRASGKFQGETGKYFEATKYGQVATTLDTAGCLDVLGRTRFVSATWLGKRPSEQINVADRS